MKKLLLSVIVVLLALPSLTAQRKSDQRGWEQREEDVRDLFQQLDLYAENEARTFLADSIQRSMIEILMEVDSFDYEFPFQDLVGSIVSEDEMLHLYSWNIPLSDGTMQYYTLMQHRQTGVTYVLAQGIPYIPKESGAIGEAAWYGALYYKLVPITYRDKLVYLAYGYRPSENGETQYKIIDVMTLTKRNVKFGAPIFKMLGAKKKQHRVIFEYDINSNFYLDFDWKKKRVIFDHLVPVRELEDGKYTLGPDDTKDALVNKKGLWMHQENVKIKEISTKPPKKMKK